MPDGRLDGCHLRSMVGLSPRVTFVVMRSRQQGKGRVVLFWRDVP